MAACLRDARELIVGKKYSYVCHAVNGSHGYDVEIKKYITNWIEQQLGSETAVMDWLVSNHPNISDSILFDDEGSKRSVYRAAWIDHMIEILEK